MLTRREEKALDVLDEVLQTAGAGPGVTHHFRMRLLYALRTGRRRPGVPWGDAVLLKSRGLPRVEYGAASPTAGVTDP